MQPTTVSIPAPRRIKATPRPCSHLHTQWTVAGAYYFFYGQLVDTTHDELICLDCGNVIKERKQARRIPRAAQLPL